MQFRGTKEKMKKSVAYFLFLPFIRDFNLTISWSNDSYVKKKAFLYFSKIVDYFSMHCV